MKNCCKSKNKKSKNRNIPNSLKKITWKCKPFRKHLTNLRWRGLKEISYSNKGPVTLAFQPLRLLLKASPTQTLTPIIQHSNLFKKLPRSLKWRRPRKKNNKLQQKNQRLVGSVLKRLQRVNKNQYSSKVPGQQWPYKLRIQEPI